MSSGEEDDIQSVPSPTISMSEDHLKDLITSLQKQHLDAQQQFLTRFAEISRLPASGNFTKCTARFDGDPDSSVEAFIDAISIFKDSSNVSDENALRGLPLRSVGPDGLCYREGL